MKKKPDIGNDNFRIIVENTLDAVFVNDVNGNYVYVNKEAVNLSGYFREELLKLNVEDLTPPENLENVKSRITKRLIGKEPVRFLEAKLLNKNEEIIPIEITITAIVWNGEPAEVVLARDISQRKNLENKIKKVSEFQKLLLSLGEEFLRIIDPENRDELINNSIKKLGEFTGTDRVYVFEYDFENNTTSNTHEWCSKGTDPEIDNLQNVPLDLFPEWVIAHKNGLPIVIKNVELLPENSVLKEILSKQSIKSLVTVPVTAGNNCRGFIGFDSVKAHKNWTEEDIYLIEYFANILGSLYQQTEYRNKLIEAKEKAERNEKIKSSFLATMSHELRTPLNAIIGFSELINPDMSLDEIIEYVQIIKNSGEHLFEMITNIFELSLLVAGENKTTPVKFNLLYLANDIAAWFLKERRRRNKEHINFNWDIPKGQELLEIYTDKGILTKILKHLLSNALKFTHQGEIRLGFEIKYDQKGNKTKKLLSCVKDTGIGIEEEKQNIIFDIFRQVDETSTRAYEGLGIGLALAKKQTDVLGGKIYFESKTGEGSTFYVELPLINQD